MASNILALTPIFTEALAAVAHCEPADAAEHFTEVLSGDSQTHPVEAFIEQYGPAPTEPAA
jgi:hypothetical protein